MPPQEFLSRALAAALAAGHPFPDYAACEAALESGWGQSQLARLANNLFGQKRGFSTREWPVLDLKTHEIVQQVDQVQDAHWAVFPDWATCFRERVELLRGKSCYQAALAATDGAAYVLEVSRWWATDPARATKVLAIHAKYFHDGTIV